MKKRIVLTAILVILACALLYKIIPLTVNVNIDSPVMLSSLISISGGSAGPANVSATPVNSQSVTVQSAEKKKNSETKPSTDDKSKKSDSDSGIPSTKKEIVQKYTDVMNKFKAEKPGYTKKEYQSLPEEYRNFSSIINRFLGFANSYMISEDDEKAVVTRSAGSEEITKEIPICGSEKACILLDYDPELNSVKSATCEPVGDGTYKLTITLNDELNCEPTPADSLNPLSAHGCIM